MSRRAVTLVAKIVTTSEDDVSLVHFLCLLERLRHNENVCEKSVVLWNTMCIGQFQHEIIYDWNVILSVQKIYFKLSLSTDFVESRKTVTWKGSNLKLFFLLFSSTLGWKFHICCVSGTCPEEWHKCLPTYLSKRKMKKHKNLHQYAHVVYVYAVDTHNH